jgi:putative SOS response-associated peptidase YedK
MINARAETVADKPAFRAAFRSRRLLVPADGFFEWRKEGGEGTAKGGKAPYWIHRAGREPFVMAGLWERWQGGGADPLHTFTILTTEAVPALREIHPRMPVILPPPSYERWLDPDAPGEDLLPLLVPFGEGLAAYRVSSLVNSPRNDLPECIQPIEP